MKLSELENRWDKARIDEPEIQIESVYPRDAKRPTPNYYVARAVGRMIADYRGESDGGRTRVLEFLRRNDGPEAQMSPVQIVTHEELFRLILGETIREPHNGGESGMAQRASTRIFAKLFGETFMISGWVPGSQVRNAGDVFELTGGPCGHCLVNPEAYGHGGGIRCLDVRNCGYWFCA